MSGEQLKTQLGVIISQSPNQEAADSKCKALISKMHEIGQPITSDLISSIIIDLTLSHYDKPVAVKFVISRLLDGIYSLKINTRNPTKNIIKKISTIEKQVQFFPSEENLKKLIVQLKKTKKSLDVCCYCITNNKLAKVIYAVHKEGIPTRVISDDETINWQGSDLNTLANAGVPVKVDKTFAKKMHNKFCIIDNKYLINGSFNFTVAAVTKNYENIMVLDDKAIISEYIKEFNSLWNNQNEFRQLESNGKTEKFLLDYQHKYNSKWGSGSSLEINNWVKPYN